ncbi:hypothetical protein PICMEDRAFT_74836 [Pichia membranifaciens NRRL Y-2026]|uniref:Uncharacterized protein n=1 Tax=Pichia membranifaciens NRRL Y-2026 TaxID=763406 RepID=A0A1E3NDM3_9ASCO|nr:hypothetical protein PICMEDRAFT_74836 [Pichia membranifaciens NRRL Y-2026]ODQ44229.1 hypothetical protein PICMEDRAFT_74836 [Pichia membranifaciens NRRL Y-2026]
MSITEKKEKSERAVDVEGLDDGLAVDYDLSENEEGTEVKGEAAEDVAGEQEGEPKEEETTVKEEKILSKKRKVTEAQKSKKKQKMEFEKESKKALSSEQTDIIVEKLSSKIREIFPQLSALELTDYYLSKSNVVDTNDFTPERGLAFFRQFIEMYMEDLVPSIKEYKKLRNKIKKYETKKRFNKNFEKTVTIPKRRFILILSISAIRACDVHRATRDIEGGSIKLIQKNPIGQDLKMLRTTWSRVLNATPSRVDKILEISKMDHEKNPDAGFSLKEDEIDAVVLDNYVDPKLRSVLECGETFELLKKLKTANPALKVYLY